MRVRFILAIVVCFVLAYVVANLTRQSHGIKEQVPSTSELVSVQPAEAVPYGVRLRIVHGPTATSGETLDVLITPDIEIYEYDSGDYFVRTNDRTEHYGSIGNYAEIETGISMIRDLYSKSLTGDALLRDVVLGSSLTGVGGQRRTIHPPTVDTLLKAGRLSFVGRATVCGEDANEYVIDRRELYPGSPGTIELYLSIDNDLRIEWIERDSDGHAVNGEWCKAREVISRDVAATLVSTFEERRTPTSRADYIVRVTAKVDSSVDVPDICADCLLSIVNIKREGSGAGATERIALATQPSESWVVLVESRDAETFYIAPQRASYETLTWDMASVETIELVAGAAFDGKSRVFGYPPMANASNDALQLDILGARLNALFDSNGMIK